MCRRFTNRVVVVTGAAGGIGRAIALQFAAEGAKIGLVDIDDAGLEGTRVDIERAGGEAYAQHCDIRDVAACRAVMGAIGERWGGVDVLVNNAGISHHGHFSDTEPDVVRRVMDVNFFGAVNCTHAALPSIAERHGAVVAISSVAGFAPLLGRTAYAASKHALHGFFDSLRAEVRDDDVDVLLVCPAYTDTAIDRHAIGANGHVLPKKTVGRLLSPKQVARAVVDGVAKGKAQIRLSWVAKTSYWMWTLSPAAYEHAMRRSHA
jgi:NAD(P)-dependent dehydrogenase (short-subunit alcohol dehydrogenase family)